MEEVRQYRRLCFRKLSSPRYFLGLWPGSVCIWRDWTPEFTWWGWAKKYRIQ